MVLLASWPIATARVHPVHLTNVSQRRAAADPQTKPTDLGFESACIGCVMTYIHHRHLLLLSPKADTHFTVPRRVRVEGWVNLGTQHAALAYIVLYRTTLHTGVRNLPKVRNSIYKATKIMTPIKRQFKYTWNNVWQKPYIYHSKIWGFLHAAEQTSCIISVKKVISSTSRRSTRVSIVCWAWLMIVKSFDRPTPNDLVYKHSKRYCSVSSRRRLAPRCTVFFNWFETQQWGHSCSSWSSARNQYVPASWMSLW